MDPGSTSKMPARLVTSVRSVQMGAGAGSGAIEEA